MRSNLRYLPGVVPAATPGPPVRPIDRDAVADRYTALLEAREGSPTSVICHLANSCADDVPALGREIDRVEELRAEQADRADELAAVIAAVRALHYETTAEYDEPPYRALVCAECGVEVGGAPCPTIAALDGGDTDG